jgi:glycosyltransferase involved in cell wall biosynthesis
MNICMLLTKPYPFDLRVKKEAETLLADGHDVTVLCRKGAADTDREIVDGVTVYRYAPTTTSRNLPDKVRYLCTQVHPYWATALREVIEAENIDALHVHDLRFADTGLSIGEQYGVPIVADLHENYPEAVRQWRRMVDWPTLVRHPAKLADRLGFPVIRYKRIERRCVRRADRLICVAEEAREHYVRDCGADPETTHVVSNRVDLSLLDRMDTQPIDHDGFLISYIGSYGTHRGLKTAIRALSHVVSEIPEARLLIVGSAGEEDYEQEIKEFCTEHNVRDNVTFTGWVDFEYVPSYIAASDICFVTHAETAHTNTTIPHKLFQYMALRRPVIVSDVKPLQRVVHDTDSGLVIPAGDHEAMANAVRKLYRHPETRAEFGENGRRAVEDRYNWENEAGTLRDVYRGLTDSGHS